MLEQKYKKLFLMEARERITDVNRALLELEKTPRSESHINDAMRAVHTIKSSAAAMGFTNFSALAHAMESIFEEARSTKKGLPDTAIEALLGAADILSKGVVALKKGDAEPDTAMVVAALQENNFARVKAVTQTTVAPIESIRVEVETLNILMNLTEELLVEKMRLSEILRRAESGVEYKETIGSLKNINESFDRLISELQYTVTEAHMVPLEQIFERFPRMVHDLAHKHKKEISLAIKGQDIELDRAVIDRLGEPLIHLLRNAIDHGIVTRGAIAINAIRERDRVIIEVSDNGRGIDWEKVKEVSKRRGIATEGGTENLIFHPQLSTKEKATETSGRGVGLSVVKNIIESLGGRVVVESQKGKGTTFTLTLPLTVAIIQALLVRTGTQIFALPFSQVNRSVRIRKNEIKKIFDQETIVVKEEDIPMIRLSKIFQCAGPESKQGAAPLKTELMVITGGEHLPTAGVVIDEVLAEQDVVVKPLTGALKGIKGFAGITFLGNGKPALILDMATLM